MHEHNTQCGTVNCDEVKAFNVNKCIDKNKKNLIAKMQKLHECNTECGTFDFP